MTDYGSAHDADVKRRLRDASLAWVFVFLAGIAWTVDLPGFVVAIPGRFEQAGAMILVVSAAWLALRSNPDHDLKGTWFLLVIGLLPAIALCGPLAGSSGLGAIVRALRFFLGLGVLALLSWSWRRDAFHLVRTHVRIMRAMTGAALLSLAVGLGRNEEGRLIAQIPALVPPQVAQFAAVGIGLTIVLWMYRIPGLKRSLLWVVAGLAAILLSQTRTATVALIAGLAVALLSSLATSRRARAAFLTLVGLALPAVVLGSSLAESWFQRGQSEENLDTLTGRTKAWELVFDVERTPYERLFGVGYGDKSIQGLPIDSGYISVFHETGLVGLWIAIGILVLLAVGALLDRRPANRAAALFLVTYVSIASYTETGIGDMSAYVLHVVLGFSVLAGRLPPSESTAASGSASTRDHHAVPARS